MQKGGRNLLTEIDNYQTFSEKEKKDICKRNLKHFLHNLGNLTPLEMECIISFFDKNNDGYIPVDDI